MNATIDLNNETLTTSKGTASIESFSKTIQQLEQHHYTAIYFICKKPTMRFLRTVKHALVLGFETFLNDTPMDYDNIKEYEQIIYDYFLFQEYDIQKRKALQLILQNAELVPYYRNNTLAEHLKHFIIESGFDVSLSSTTHRDKPQHTTYKGEEYSYTHVRRAPMQEETLLDLLLQYINIKWYVAHDFVPEITTRDEYTPKVLPLSACERGVTMALYSD